MELISHYAGLTVRGTGPDITAIRLSEEAPLLTNRHIALYNDYFKKRATHWKSMQNGKHEVIINNMVESQRIVFTLINQ